MKRSTRSTVSLLLCALLALTCLAGCGKDSGKQTEPTNTPVVNPGVVTTPTETAPQTVPEPEVKDPVTAYPEAFELLEYLKVLTAEDAAAFSQNLTGEIATRALSAIGASTKISASAETVTGTQFLGDVMKLLGYKTSGDEAMLDAANRKAHLTRGFYAFDGSAALTVEQAANILDNALQAYIVDGSGNSTGTKLCESFKVAHFVISEYEEPFNRPGSTWMSTETNQPVTGEYTAQPVVILGNTTSWCDILHALGFDKDDPANDQHIPKYFRLSVDGGQLTEKFWKHHNGDDGHSECANDFTGEQDASLEIYMIDDYEFRSIYAHNFLAVSDENGLTVYGFERSEYGPYTEASRPAYGIYIAHHYWNAYGMGNGYEIMEPAQELKGTLSEGNVLTTTIDGQEYQNGQSYSYGKKLTTAPANMGKEYTFLLDRYGFLLGCVEAPVE